MSVDLLFNGVLPVALALLLAYIARGAFQKYRSSSANRAYDRASARLNLRPGPVTYCRIRETDGSQKILGWIPLAAARECGADFPEDDDNTPFYLKRETSMKLRKHPLWLSDEDFERLSKPQEAHRGEEN